MASEDTPISFDEFMALSDAQKMIRYLRGQSVFYQDSFLGLSFFMIYTRYNTLAPVLIDTLEATSQSEPEQLANVVALWLRLYFLTQDFGQAESDRHALIENVSKGAYGELGSAGERLDRDALLNFWEEGSGGKVSFKEGIVPTQWQIDFVTQLRDRDVAIYDYKHILLPTYHDFKSAAEAWFCASQDADKINQFLSENRVIRQIRLLKEIIEPVDIDKDEEDDEEESLREQLCPISHSWIDTTDFIKDAVRTAESEGAGDISIEISPSDLMETTERIVRLSWADWELIKKHFWNAVDVQKDPNTRKAEAKWELAATLADKAVFVLRRESERLQRQSIAEGDADAMASQLPEVIQLMHGVASTANRHYYEMYHWFAQTGTQISKDLIEKAQKWTLAVSHLFPAINESANSKKSPKPQKKRRNRQRRR